MVSSILFTFIQETFVGEKGTVPIFSFKVINKYPHDPEAFTQGLVIDKGILYESTGLNGKSSLRVVNLETGNISLIKILPYRYFGEGITVIDNRIIQLTWKSHEAFVYDQETLEQVDTFNINSDGWGLTKNEKSLILSDGTSTLYFLNSMNYSVERKVFVSNNGIPIERINELEYIKGKVYANIWQTNRIVIIDPNNGNVTGWLNLDGIQEYLDYTTSIDVLNGIAYNQENDKIYITGKFWPNLFEIELDVLQD